MQLLSHSLMEPEVDVRGVQSEQSSTALHDHRGPNDEHSLGKQAKVLWQKLKDEDEERKEGKVKHVSQAEATKISG